MTEPQQVIAGRYVVEAMIGQGGMGTVYRGLDRETGMPVAIKALRPEILYNDPATLERFIREGEALRQLDHPNIVGILDSIQETEEQHYLIMEYVAGGSLLNLLRQTPRPPVEQVISISLGLADALTRAHQLDIIHRDLKPANVLLSEDGVACLTDFGVARIGESQLTETGVLLGTLAYLSPEACRSETLDGRADIWSFGVMLYEMLAGRLPFAGDNPAATLTAILMEPVPDLEALRPELPVALVDLVYRMLEKDRRARIGSVRQVGAALEAIMQATGSLQPVLPADAHSGRFVTPPPATRAARHNLPAQPTPFVGREADLRAIADQLADPDVRLLTILGPGGMGKTRLALEAAGAQPGNFDYGVFYVPLAPISDPSFIAPTIADALKFTFLGQDEPQVELINFLREKHALLVLDNYEHVVAGAGLVAEILAAAPAVKVLATSRERLRLSSETLFPITGLELPDPAVSDAADPAALKAYSAAQLFLQSARRVLPDFHFTAQNAPVVTRIIHQVDGMPLGIELAAAWLEMLAVEEIEAEIARSLDFLETDLRDVPERHRSLRAVFDYSWQLLSEPERDALQKLAIFRGGFERDAAQGVAGASLRALTGLINKSLLRRSPDGRYAMHTLLRQYVEEQFEAHPDALAVRQAHAAHYLALLAAREDEFNGPREMRVIQRIEAEVENIRLAWRFALHSGCWDEIGPALYALALYYQARSLLREGVDRMAELVTALEAANAGDQPIGWCAKALQAMFTGRLGHYDDSAALAQACLDYFTAQDDRLYHILTLNTLSYAHMMRGNYAASKARARQACALAEGMVNSSARFTAVGNLGYAEYLHGNYEEARRIYEGSIQRLEAEQASRISLAFAKNNLGEIMQALGDFPAARALYAEAYDIFRQYRNRRGMGFTLNNLGGITFMLGEHADARQAYQESYDLSREIGDRRGLAHALSALGNVAYAAGDTDEARRCYQESLEIRQQIGDQRGIADSQADLASVAIVTGDLAQGNRLHREALTIRRAIDDRPGIARSLLGIALTHGMLSSDPGAAREYVQEALALAEELGNRVLTGQALAALGETHNWLNQHAQAGPLFRRSLRLAREMQLLPLIAFNLAGLAAIRAATGDPTGAVELLALVLRHPPHTLDMAAQWASMLQASLQQAMPAEDFAAAQARGRARDLEAVVAELLAEDWTAA